MSRVGARNLSRFCVIATLISQHPRSLSAVGNTGYGRVGPLHVLHRHERGSQADRTQPTSRTTAAPMARRYQPSASAAIEKVCGNAAFGTPASDRLRCASQHVTRVLWNCNECKTGLTSFQRAPGTSIARHACSRAVSPSRHALSSKFTKHIHTPRTVTRRSTEMTGMDLLSSW